MKEKYKHYATGKIIEIEIKDREGIYKGKSFKVVKDRHDRTQLKGTSFFRIEKEVIENGTYDNG